MRPVSKGILLIAASIALGACSSDTRAELVVASAASLADVFAELGSAFDASGGPVEVVLNLGGSGALREQIVEGAPVDVFASADEVDMRALVEAGAVSGSGQPFASNPLQIAVPSGNPAGVSGLGSFADGDLLIGLCIETAPCGRLGRQVLARAGITPSLDTEEPDVRALLTKVGAGELDAGIVYVTDVLAAEGLVEGIDIPDDVNVAAEYWIAALADADDAETAASFVAFVLSDDGQAILADHGFGSP